MEFSDALWRKSSFSSETADCVEIAYPDWRKSSFSGTETECVEVAYPTATPTVGIRDSKNPAPALMFPAPHWHRGLGVFKTHKP